MKLVIGILLVGLIVLVGCAPTIPLQFQCETANDCVPAECCHSSLAVNSAYAPDCENAICTASCEPGTLDCGQGSIECISNMCQVVLNE